MGLGKALALLVGSCGAPAAGAEAARATRVFWPGLGVPDFSLWVFV